MPLFVPLKFFKVGITGKKETCPECFYARPVRINHCTEEVFKSKRKGALCVEIVFFIDPFKNSSLLG